MSVDHQTAEARFLEARILAPFLLTALIWGSTWIAIKYQLGDVPPSWSVTWRFTGAAIGMFAFAAFKGWLLHGFLNRLIHQLLHIFRIHRRRQCRHALGFRLVDGDFVLHMVVGYLLVFH